MWKDFIFWSFYHFRFFSGRLKRRSVGGFEKQNLLVRHRISTFCGAPGWCATELFFSNLNPPPSLTFCGAPGHVRHRNQTFCGGAPQNYFCDVWMRCACGASFPHLSVAHLTICVTEIKHSRFRWRTCLGAPQKVSEGADSNLKKNLWHTWQVRHRKLTFYGTPS